MAIDQIVEGNGLPVNEQGEILATFGTGDRSIAGLLPSGFIPMRTDSGFIPISLPEYNPTSIHDVLYFNANIPSIPTNERAFFWSDEYQCLVMTMPGGVAINLGQENVVYALAGEDISNGDVVYFFTSGDDYPIVKKASNLVYEEAYRVMGVATQDGLTGEHVVITSLGLVHDLDTTAYVAGDVLYLGSTAGGITATRPTADKTVVRIGYVNIVSAIDGEIFIAPPQVEMNSAGSYVDVQLRATTQAVPTTPTLFVWPVEIADTLGIYNNTTGEFVIPFTGQWNFSFYFNCESTSSTRQLYAAAQIYNGTTWVPSEYSTRQDAVRNGELRQVLFSSTNQFAAGTRLRFVVWCSANVNLITTSVATGYTVPAARLLVTGVKTI